MREYLTNMRDGIMQRNIVCNEYYKNKIALNEKKNKKLLLDSRLWEVDSEICKHLELDPEVIRKDPDMAKKFFFPEVILSGYIAPSSFW